MKIQLQTNFTANCDLKSNTAQNPDVSRICFGTRANSSKSGDEFGRQKRQSKTKPKQYKAPRQFTSALLELGTPIQQGQVLTTRRDLLMAIDKQRHLQAKGDKQVKVIYMPGWIDKSIRDVRWCLEFFSSYGVLRYTRNGREYPCTVELLDTGNRVVAGIKRAATRVAKNAKV
jgi:hypothetical protein